MIKVYNPIYDSVFKYLMQNDASAKILLGSILNKKIISLEMKNNDYVVTTKNGISVLRIDFGATIQEKDKTPEIVTIELQKAVAQGEIMRFRKYLGFQYQNDANCLYETEKKDDGKVYEKETPFHIYAIYILGHTIGNGLKYAVLKDSHVFSDDKGNVVEIPKTNKFVNGLTHDTIIVQIPYVKKESAKTHLEKLLSIFDQSQAVDDKYIELDDDRDDSSEYQQIMKTLLKATGDQQVKGELELEEEVEKALDGKDKQIEALQNELTEQQNKMAEQQNKMAEQEDQLASMVRMLKGFGMSVEEIAEKTRLSANEIAKLLK